MPPPGSRGREATRVHKTTPDGLGSPEATPRVNGYGAASGAACSRPVPAERTQAAVAAVQRRLPGRFGRRDGPGGSDARSRAGRPGAPGGGHEAQTRRETEQRQGVAEDGEEPLHRGLPGESSS